jgi:hypothetical protein
MTRVYEISEAGAGLAEGGEFYQITIRDGFDWLAGFTPSRNSTGDDESVKALFSE